MVSSIMPRSLLPALGAAVAVGTGVPACAAILGADKDYVLSTDAGVTAEAASDGSADAGHDGQVAADGVVNDGMSDGSIGVEAGAGDADAGSDGGSTGYCATHPHKFCDDFDNDGTFPGPWSVTTNNATGLFASDTYTSPPLSLELQAADPGPGQNTIWLDHACGVQPGPVSAATIQLDVRLDSNPFNGTGAVVLAGILAPDGGHAIEIFVAAGSVNVRRTDTNEIAPIGPFPSTGQWVHASIAAVFGGTAAATFNGMTANVTAMGPALVTARLSLYANGPLGTSVTLHFDNVTCDWN
jgi:hypothetical protein